MSIYTPRAPSCRFGVSFLLQSKQFYCFNKSKTSIEIMRISIRLVLSVLELEYFKISVRRTSGRARASQRPPARPAGGGGRSQQSRRQRARHRPDEPCMHMTYDIAAIASLLEHKRPTTDQRQPVYTLLIMSKRAAVNNGDVPVTNPE